VRTCRSRGARYAAGMSDDFASRESNDLPQARLCVGVTGHRDGNAAFVTNRAAIETALAAVFEELDAAAPVLPGGAAPTRLHSLLAPGADMMAMELALSRGWEVVAPLPFGLELSIALNCSDGSDADARALASGKPPPSPEIAAQASAMRDLAGRVQLFELAEQDGIVAERFMATMAAADDRAAATAYAIIASERAAVAARVMIEQSDLLVAIWDGASPGSIGGTRHTIENALYHGAPVIWIDASAPGSLRLLVGPDALERLGPEQELAEIGRAVAEIVRPPDPDHAARTASFHAARWHPRSSRRFHAYRRIEAMFGGAAPARPFRSLVEHYEAPDAIAAGSGAPFLAAARALPGADAAFIDRIRAQLFSRFALADGLSTYLSDAYRGGMVMNFLLSSLAVIAGAAYLPLVGVDWKWPFALTELLLLLAIVAITVVGRRRRWHGRWLETRRVAEYLRHTPILLLLGVARPAARWPQGSSTQWPEYYARQALRAVGLPRIVVTQAYLRAALATLLARHAETQQAYHRAKAVRLATVHHRLDRLSEVLFVLAIVSVATYLLLIIAGALDLVPAQTGEMLAKPLTFLGIALPALGGAFAGIRYLGDFERFAAISDIAAEKLESLSGRIDTLLAGAEAGLHYAQVASIAHALDDVVIAEIESWQSVFAAKNMAVPV
jgi:hypothetical protein